MQTIPALLLASLALGLAQDPVAKPTEPAGTWILQVEGNATTLRVTGASLKPFSYRPKRGLNSDFSLRLFDAKGSLLKTIPLDLTDYCMKPEHREQGPHVRGDVIVEHKVACTIKIPARSDIAEIRIEKRIEGEPPVLLGKTDRTALLALTNKKEVR